MNVHRKNITLSQLGAEKIAFPPKSDGQTDISNYRITLLPKSYCFMLNFFKTFTYVFTQSKNYSNTTFSRVKSEKRLLPL